MERAGIGAAERLRAEIEGAARHSLPRVTAELWRAFGNALITEAEATALSGMIEARTRPAVNTEKTRITAPRPARPRPRESVERRRRWVAAGYLPPRIAQSFTPGETAALAVISNEAAKRGACTLCHGAVAALAGVSVSTVKRAIRAARVLGLVSVRERRVSRFRSDSNVVSVISKAWTAWLSMGRRGGGVQSRTGTTTGIQDKGPQRAGFRVLGAIRGRSRPGRDRSAAGRSG